MFRAKLRTLVCKPPVNCSVTHKPLDNKNNGTCYDCYQFVIKRLIEIAETRINTGFFKQLDLFTINKSYQRLKGQDVITSPKTKKSNRTIKMPKFLCEEMKEYLGMLYGLKKKDRIFTVTKSYLHHEMDRGAKAAGVKRIRIHDLRHSHISLLIDMGFSAVAIADRVGHESIDITYQYAHLFPSKQIEMAEKLDDLGKGDFENVS